MKVLLYGETTAPGSGAWCYARTFREMGHELIEHEDQDGLEPYRRSLPLRAYRKVTGNTLPVHHREHGARLVARVERERPELVVVLKGLNVSRTAVEGMRRAGAFVVIVNHDDFFSFNRSNWSPLQRQAIAAYDHVFTTREVNVAEVRPLNPRVEFFEFAYEPAIHRPVPIPDAERDRWDTDVVFVGTWERERAGLLEHLVRQLPVRCAVWGTQWEKLAARSPLRKFVHQRPVVMDDMAKALGGAKIALAFLRKANRDDYTQRTFEIPACGGLLLAERTARHQQYYREGVEAEFFDPRDPTELERKVRDLLADDVRRTSIRDAGMRALARQRHTYRDRLERLIQVYREATASP